MLGKTDPQTDFFDSYIEPYCLPQEHELLKIKEKVDFSFIEEKTKDLYAKASGRSSYPPEVMFKILFLEFYYNLSDVEVVKQRRFSALFRYFCGIKIEDSLPDDTSLVVFRRRLKEERFERIFDELVKQCKEKGLLGERLKAMDATHIAADVAIPNTVNLLRKGRKRILGQLQKEKKKLDQSLKKYLPKDSSRKPSKEDLIEELQLSNELIGKLQGKHSSGVEEFITLLEKVAHPEKKKKLDSFIYTEKEAHSSAQKGHSSIGKTYHQDGYVYYFPSRLCRQCDEDRKCSCNAKMPNLYVSQSHLLYLETDPEERKEASRKRRRIEAKFGQAKKHYKMARARYRDRQR